METDYLTFSDAQDFVSGCKNKGVFIYGIEKFLGIGKCKQPDLDGIADFSSLDSREETASIDASKLFLAKYEHEENVFFKIVYIKK